MRRVWERRNVAPKPATQHASAHADGPCMERLADEELQRAAAKKFREKILQRIESDSERSARRPAREAANNVARLTEPIARYLAEGDAQPPTDHA